MRLRDRDVRRVIAAPLRPRHWRALRGLLTDLDPGPAALARYLANAGRYPWTVRVRTPTGPVAVTLRDRHDLLTVNEIFCRRDYGDGDGVRVVVDVGANVGLAALYFLTRDPRVRVHCFEPDPANVAVLRRTLAGHEGRYVLDQRVVTPDRRESVEFVPAGRYGHTARPGERADRFPAVPVSDVLAAVLAAEGEIDLVKIDTEGSELELVRALCSCTEGREVTAVVYEDGRGRARWLDGLAAWAGHGPVREGGAASR